MEADLGHQRAGEALQLSLGGSLRLAKSPVGAPSVRVQGDIPICRSSLYPPTVGGEGVRVANTIVRL